MLGWGTRRVGRVRITSGNAALGPNETAALDLVVMDDFIYSEPLAPSATQVPEPASVVLLGSGLAALLRMRKKQ